MISFSVLLAFILIYYGRPRTFASAGTMGVEPV